MIKVGFRIPHPKDVNFEAWLPAVPREGETVESSYGVHTVHRVVWFTDAEDKSPYLILE